MASVIGDYGDYGEDWEEEEPSVFKANMIAADQRGHSMENDTRDAEPTQVAMLDAPLDCNPPAGPSKVSGEKFKSVRTNENVVDTSAISAEVPTSEDTLSSIEGEKSTSTDPVDTAYRPGVSKESPDLDKRNACLDLVRIHGTHYDQKTPPPAPLKVSVPNNSTEVKSPPKADRGALQARVAAKRVMEFRRRQAIKEEELRALESAWTQTRREIRRSNDPMHRELGVAGLSAQDHLRLAQRRRKAKAKQEEHAVSLERQNRWYNNIPKRTASASDHVRKLNLQYRQARYEQQQTIRLNQKSIQSRQLKLRQEAHDIIVKNQGEYVQGSYLLKVTHRKMKSHVELPLEKLDEHETE